MTNVANLSAPALRVKEQVRKWWASVPAHNRRAQYSITFFTEKFGANTANAGPALRALGWTHLQQQKTEQGYVRLWAPPGATTSNTTPGEANEALLRRQLEDLRKQIRHLSEENLTDRYIKEKIFQLRDAPLTLPEWLIEPKKSGSMPGVPTLFASDWHWGEVVFPKQIGGVNKFNLAVAHDRARRLIEHAIDLLTHHTVNPNFPGIVFALGGDMVSGDIHEELQATNEFEIMAVAVDIINVLVWCVTRLKEKFGRVFLPCVTGNHGRLTHKMRAKGRNFTSVDWLIYKMLQMHFKDDAEVTFHIPDGSDALYRIYGHRYLLTHGDQFRGGDGMIGALGPIIRGDHRKRSRNMQVGMGYDTMMIGHWHQLIQLQRLIVNGSLKGYDEYAYTNNFPFEPPRQALWLTHPQHGITISMPVLLDPKQQKFNADEWVSLPKAA